MDEVLKTIPIGLQEASYSLGSTKTETAYKIFFRQALPGFATAILLAFGRGIGDAASVLFTAGYTDHVPRNFSDPTATLPLAIFFQLGSPIQEVQDRAFAAAIILTLIVLCISITARVLYRGKK
jgi:phosphate transport system permease protein